jgi:predicted ester cyclase
VPISPRAVQASRLGAEALKSEQYAVVADEPKDVIEELFRRGTAGDESVIDELIAEDMLNHAAGPARQGREGWKQIIATIRTDLGSDFSVENHHLIGEGDLVAHHMTLRGHHQASTMPLLAGVVDTGTDVTWTYVHIWRVVNGRVVEHWACRDDVGLLRQVGAWPPTMGA